MAKQSGLSYEQIITELQNKQYRPIYLLMGDEDYYIDRIADYIAQNVLTKDEKEFNYTQLYGKDTDCDQIIMAAKRYPLMSQYQVIMVKEAQDIKDLSNMAIYLQKPLVSSIIVLCYKHKTIDRRTKAAAAIGKIGILFESKRLYDYQVPDWITRHCQSLKLNIDPKAANLLAEFLGTDLSRIVNEINKLRIVMNQQGINTINSEIIEKNIGISKDYNAFELVKAIGTRNNTKAFRIAEYMADKDKNGEILTPATSIVFNFFANLLQYLQLPDKSEYTAAAELKILPFFVKEYADAAKHFDSKQILNALGEIRKLDTQMKGFGVSTNKTNRDKLRETLFRILDCKNRNGQ